MSSFRLMFAALLAVLVIGGASCVTPVPSVPAVYERVQPAAVEILVNGRMAGSGSIVDAGGSVLIAAHMLPAGNEAHLEAHSSTLGRQPLRLIALDLAHDLALLQLPLQAEEYPHLTIAQRSPGPGEPVYLYGAPVFRHDVMISGKIARAQPTFEFYDGAFREILHISGISPIGTSGGPWVNARGELIGVQSAAMTIKGAHQGIAYASPLASLKGLLEKKKTVQSATMQTGVEELWKEPSFISKLRIFKKMLQRVGYYCGWPVGESLEPAWKAIVFRSTEQPHLVYFSAWESPAGERLDSRAEVSLILFC